VQYSRSGRFERRERSVSVNVTQRRMSMERYVAGRAYAEHSEGLPQCNFFCFWRDNPQWARASSFTRFLDHTQRRTTVGRTPLDE